MKKPRVAIYYSTAYGRNDGAPLYYFNVLKHKLGLDTVHLSPKGDTSKFGKFDLHFWVDWGEDGLPWQEWEIPKDGGKTIYVASDTHLDNGYRFNKAKKFDYAFFNQKDAAEKSGCPWLPHAAEPQAYPNINIMKKYDVGFVGHVQTEENYNGMTRIEALDRLFKAFPNFYYGSRNAAFPEKNLFEDAAKKFSLSRIVFNISIKDDINMRIFEALSTGSFLLTNYLPTLGELFEDGKHLVMYNSYDEMIAKAKHYLKNDEEREKIAKAGYEEFINKHTYEHRVREILKTVGFPQK